MFTVRRSFVVAGFLLGGVLSPNDAAAQGNFKLAPVGGRTTLVGGTGVVYGRDSASAFLNPATVVRVDHGRLAFSVNFYQLSSFNAKSWYAPGQVDRANFGDIQRDDAKVTSYGFESLPGSLCIFLRVGDIPFLSRGDRKGFDESQARLGLCIASVSNTDFSLNNENYDQTNASGASRQAQTVRHTFRRIAAGPSYAMFITNALAFGASVHVTRTGFRSIFESTSTTTASGRTITQAFYNSAHGDSYDVSATVGATYRIGRYQAVGVALEVPSLHAFGSGGINRYTHFEGAGDGTSAVTATGDFAAYTPLRVSLGTGIKRAWGSAELNVSYHLPLASAYHAQLSGRAVDTRNGTTNDRAIAPGFSAQTRSVVNVGVGGEAFIAPYLSVLAGLSTDLSSVRSRTLSQDRLGYFASNTHRLAGSLGLGSHGTGGSLLIGGELSYEWGDRLAVNSYQLPARFESVDSQSFGLLFVIAGTTSFSVIKRAVNDITNAVPVLIKPETPAPPPAAPSTPTSPPDDTKG